MKLVRLSSWGMCAVVLAFFVTASTPPRAGQSFAKPVDGRPSATTQPVIPEEWAAIGKWMSDHHCEARYNFIDGLQDRPLKEKAEKLIAERFRMIERQKDSEVRDAMIAELQAQDRIFALQIEYRRSRKHEKLGEKAMGEMKTAVANLIDARVTHLEAEAKQLQRRKNDPQFIAHQAQSYLNNAEPRQLRSQGELGVGSGSESSDADVAQ